MFRKSFALLLTLLFLTSNCFAANGWKKETGADVFLSNDSPSTIYTSLKNYAVDPLDILLNYYTHCSLTYTSAAIVTVQAGEVVTMNSGNTVRMFRQNTTTTTVNTANSGAGGIDTGAVGASANYYVFADADAGGPTFTAIASLSPTAPTGVTNYRLIGSFQTDGSKNILNYTVAGIGAGRVVQVVNFETGTRATGSTAITSGAGIPTNTQGDQFMALTFTPTSATNKLKITITVIGSPTTGAQASAALFQDSTANALATCWSHPAQNEGSMMTFTHFMTAGTTSATTFKVRVGTESGGYEFNGYGGTQLYGGTLVSSITIEEIQS